MHSFGRAISAFGKGFVTGGSCKASACHQDLSQQTATIGPEWAIANNCPHSTVGCALHCKWSTLKVHSTVPVLSAQQCLNEAKCDTRGTCPTNISTQESRVLCNLRMEAYSRRCGVPWDYASDFYRLSNGGDLLRSRGA